LISSSLERLRGGELLAGSGGALLAVAMFLPWFGKVSPYCQPFPGYSCGRNFDAWKAFGFTDVVLLAAALAGIGVAVLAGASSKTDAQITSAAITVPIGLLATVLVLYRVFEPVGKLDTRFGLFLGLAACLAITYGSWRALRNDRPSRASLAGEGRSPPDAGGGGAKAARRAASRPASQMRSRSSSG
jgi:hypothetical protein